MEDDAMAARGGSGGGLVVVFGLLAVVGGGYGLYQHAKRKSEAEQSRKELDELRATLSLREEELRALKARLGPRNEQVRLLVQEVQRLRQLVSVRALGLPQTA